MAFDCKACTEDVCQKMFNVNRPGGRRRPKSSQKRDFASFRPRDEERVRQLVLEWDQYVHPRARDFFPSHNELIETLCTIARSVNQVDDPILVSLFSSLVFLIGRESVCVLVRSGVKGRSSSFGFGKTERVEQIADICEPVAYVHLCYRRFLREVATSFKGTIQDGLR